MKRFTRMSAFVAIAGVLLVGQVGATNVPETSQGSGVYQATISVPGVGENCSAVSVQVTYTASDQSCGFQHGGGAANQTTTGTTTATTNGGSTGTASYPAGTTGVVAHSNGASGVALPIKIAKGLTGGTLTASANGTVTYSFTMGDCSYSITLTVNFDSSGNVTSVTSNP